MKLLSIESYWTYCNISFGTSVQDSIIWDFVHIPQLYGTIVQCIIWDYKKYILLDLQISGPQVRISTIWDFMSKSNDLALWDYLSKNSFGTFNNLGKLSKSMAFEHMGPMLKGMKITIWDLLSNFENFYHMGLLV